MLTRGKGGRGWRVAPISLAISPAISPSISLAISRAISRAISCAISPCARRARLGAASWHQGEKSPIADEALHPAGVLYPGKHAQLSG